MYHNTAFDFDDLGDENDDSNSDESGSEEEKHSGPGAQVDDAKLGDREKASANVPDEDNAFLQALGDFGDRDEGDEEDEVEESPLAEEDDVAECPPAGSSLTKEREVQPSDEEGEVNEEQAQAKAQNLLGVVDNFAKWLPFAIDWAMSVLANDADGGPLAVATGMVIDDQNYNECRDLPSAQKTRIIELMMEKGFAERLLTSVGKLEEKKAADSLSVQGASKRKRYCIVGSWTDWKLSEMHWNDKQQCYVCNVMIGTNGWESFQILEDGDFSKCIHPDRPDASSHVQYRVRGPDKRGHGLNWTIGTLDKASLGVYFEIRLYLPIGHVSLRVDWVLLGDAPPEPEEGDEYLQALTELEDDDAGKEVQPNGRVVVNVLEELTKKSPGERARFSNLFSPSEGEHSTSGAGQASPAPADAREEEGGAVSSRKVVDTSSESSKSGILGRYGGAFDKRRPFASGLLFKPATQPAVVNPEKLEDVLRYLTSYLDGKSEIYVLFQIENEFIPMKLWRPELTPQELAEVWEKEWKVRFATRLKFAKPRGMAGKYLSARLDTVPLQPKVVPLEGTDSVVRSLAKEMKQRSPVPGPDLLAEARAAGQADKARHKGRAF